MERSSEISVYLVGWFSVLLWISHFIGNMYSCSTFINSAYFCPANFVARYCRHCLLDNIILAMCL